MIDLKVAREKLNASKEDKTLEEALKMVEAALESTSGLQRKIKKLKEIS